MTNIDKYSPQVWIVCLEQVYCIVKLNNRHIYKSKKELAPVDDIKIRLSFIECAPCHAQVLTFVHLDNMYEWQIVEFVKLMLWHSILFEYKLMSEL